MFAEHFYADPSKFNFFSAKSFLLKHSKRKKKESFFAVGSGSLEYKESPTPDSEEKDFFFFPSSLDLGQKTMHPLSIQPFFESTFITKISFFFYSKYPSNLLTSIKTQFQTDMYGLEIYTKTRFPSKFFSFLTRVDFEFRVKSNKMNISKLIKIKLSFFIKHCSSQSFSSISTTSSCFDSESSHESSIIPYYISIPLVARPSRENIFLLDGFHNLVFPHDSRPVRDFLENSSSLERHGVSDPSFKNQSLFRSTQNFDFRGDSLYTNLVYFFEKLASFGIFVEVSDRPYDSLGRDIFCCCL